LDERAWKTTPSLDTIDRFFLLGIPAELARIEHSSDPEVERVTRYPTCTFNHVELIDERPAEFTVKPGPRIYGRIELRGPQDLEDIKGMSGGPLFGFKCGDDGNDRYWLFGIQSSWHRASKRIEVSPFKPLGLALGNAIRQVLDR
jgi:hypothetical protein